MPYKPTPSKESNLIASEGNEVQKRQNQIPRHTTGESNVNVKKRAAKKSLLCKCCCGILIVMITLILTLAILIAIFFPKKPNFELVSFDPMSQVVVDVTSTNFYDIKIVYLKGNFEYEGDRIGEFNLENAVIKAKSTSRITIPLDLKPTPAMLKQCMSNNQIPVKINIKVLTPPLSWIKKPISKRGIDYSLPCPNIPNLSNMDLGKIPLKADNINMNQIQKLNTGDLNNVQNILTNKQK